MHSGYRCKNLSCRHVTYKRGIGVFEFDSRQLNIKKKGFDFNQNNPDIYPPINGCEMIEKKVVCC